jgi:hypothetical protein
MFANANEAIRRVHEASRALKEAEDALKQVRESEALKRREDELAMQKKRSLIESDRFRVVLAELQTKSPHAAKILENQTYDPTPLVLGYPTFSQGRFLFKLGRFALMQSGDYDTAPLRFTAEYEVDEELEFDNEPRDCDFLKHREYRDPMIWFESSTAMTPEDYFEETVVLYVAYRLGGEARVIIDSFLGLVLLIRLFALENGLLLVVTNQ